MTTHVYGVPKELFDYFGALKTVRRNCVSINNYASLKYQLDLSLLLEEHKAQAPCHTVLDERVVAATLVAGKLRDQAPATSRTKSTLAFARKL